MCVPLSPAPCCVCRPVAQDNGTMTVTVLKAEPGQHFEDLDLVTKLLQPKSSLQQALGDARKCVGGG